MTHKMTRQPRIVMMGNNPDPDFPLDLEAEARAIEAALADDSSADATLPVIVYTQSTTLDLYDVLRTPSLQVLHLSGHGTQGHGMVTTDADGMPVPLGAATLPAILRLVPHLRLLVLNGCYTRAHAQAIAARFGGCVVGIGGKLDDRAARGFARLFYRGLARGLSVKQAFEWAHAFYGAEYGDEFGAYGFYHGPHIDPNELKIDGVPVHSSTKTEPPAIQSGDDDVVITANLTTPWRDVISHAPGAAPLVIDVPSPARGWQRDEPDPEQWHAFAAALDAKVAEALDSGRSRIHVAVKTGFTFGVLLARALERHGDAVSFYQEDGSVDGGAWKGWRSWGPAPHRRPAGGDRAAFFNAAPVPAEPSSAERHILLLVGVTGAIPVETARAATGVTAAQSHSVQLLPLRGTGLAALSLEQVDRAASELDRALSLCCERFPRTPMIHFFYHGPLALLMRATGRVHLRDRPIRLYEYFPRAGGPVYRPTLDCREGTLLVGGVR
ncbi:MAG: hypothetical protein R3F65_19760 [bacterium]